LPDEGPGTPLLSKQIPNQVVLLLLEFGQFERPVRLNLNARLHQLLLHVLGDHEGEPMRQITHIVTQERQKELLDCQLTWRQGLFGGVVVGLCVLAVVELLELLLWVLLVNGRDHQVQLLEVAAQSGKTRPRLVVAVQFHEFVAERVLHHVARRSHDFCQDLSF